MKLISPKVPCRCGPKLQKVREVAPGGEFHGVPLLDEQRRRPTDRVPFLEVTGAICTDLVARLQSRFDMDDDLVAATSIVNKNTWPDNNDARGMCG